MVMSNYVFVDSKKNDKLDWSKRYKIALGTVDDLMYLHEVLRSKLFMKILRLTIFLGRRILSFR